MVGLSFDFDKNDIVVSPNGNFLTATTDNQNVALIAVSQVCRLTKPEVGAQVVARIVNRHNESVASVFADAKRQARDDGALNVVIGFTEDEQLIFRGNYDN